MVIDIKTKLNFFALISIFFVVTSCATYGLVEKEVYGVYELKENKAIQLRLEKDSFVLIDTYKQKHLPSFKCCDTIAYGNWNMDKKSSLIELNSPEILNDSYVYMEVEEELQSSIDSISFVIDSPIEEHYRKFGEKYREVIYSVSLTTNEGFEVHTSDDNPLFIKRNDGLKSFEITIYPKYDIPIRKISTREVYTIPYEIKNPEANVFKIKIPLLDYGYLSYLRLSTDYVKIINKNKLLWDGKEYIKK